MPKKMMMNMPKKMMKQARKRRPVKRKVAKKRGRSGY